MKRIVAVLVLVLAACAGRTVGDADGGVSDGSAGDAGGDGAADAGIDCGQPAHTTYDCPRGADGGACGRYGGAGDVAPLDASFPLGCTVTLPTCSTFGGAQTCNCEPFPAPGGDASPQWICPL